jgi:hypothetical protein
LAYLVERWPMLHEATKLQILAIGHQIEPQKGDNSSCKDFEL